MKLFTLLVFTILSFTAAFAQPASCNALTNSPTFSLDECNGTVTFTINALNRAGIDITAIDDFEVDYRYTGQTSWTNVIDLERSSSSPNTLWQWGADDIRIHYNNGTGTSASAFGSDNTQGAKGYNVTWTIPAIVLTNGGLEFRVYRAYSSTGIPVACNLLSYHNTTTESTFTLPSYNAPQNLNAEDNVNCNNVVLTWTAATQIPGCLSTKWKTDIERKETSGTGPWQEVISNLPGVTQTYPDNSAVPGVLYSYRLITKIDYGSNRIITSAPTPDETGQRKGVPDVPIISSASDDLCNSLINVSWPAAVGASTYNVFWNNNAGSSSSNSGISLASYGINNVVRGTVYDIQISATNNCGTSALSAVETGISPDNADDPTSVSVSQENDGSITVDWDDVIGSSNYVVEISKTNSQNITTNSEVTVDTISFNLTDVDACHIYTFKVKGTNDCSPSGGTGTNSSPISVNSELSNSFSALGLQGSKGYFSNRVELIWDVTSNGNLLEGFEFLKRPLGETNPPTLINSTSNPNSNIYFDYQADAGVLYEYFVYGFGSCNDTTIYTDTISSIGFRTSTGIINGEVSYLGGIAVEGVKILVENANGPNGYSHYFDGTNRAENLSPNLPSSNVSEMTIESWVKFDAAPTGPWSALSDCDGPAISARIGGNVNDYVFRIIDNSGTISSATFPIALSDVGEWVHLAGVFSDAQDSIYLYLNGNLVSAVATTISSIEISSMCAGDDHLGFVEEARWWDDARSSEEIAAFFDIQANGTETDLIGYWNFNENVGDYAYDGSHQGPLYNRNNLFITSNVDWSNVIPTANQLSIAAYTDSSGDYNVIVPYIGIGQNFTVTPAFLTHEFNPDNQVLTIGNGATVQNNIDFVDNSSFQFTGTLFYEGTTCAVEDAFVKIDGVIVTDIDNLPVTTNSAGFFDIQVPIGLHSVSVEKAGHVFNVGRYPPTGQIDFQAPVFNIPFKDSTRVKVIGRVVGGLREANKFPGSDRSKNNIGVAEVIFTTPDNCSIETIYTDTLTGNYEAYVLPTIYNMTVGIPMNPTLDFGTLDFVDLSLIPPLQTITDTLGFDTLTNNYTIDSITFQKNLDYIYRVEEPTIEVFVNDSLGVGFEPIRGDRELSIVNYNTTDDVPIVVDLQSTNPFPYDVFTEKHSEEDFKYRLFILVAENYVNIDDPMNPILDTVQTSDGRILINNNLALSPSTGVKVSDFVTDPDQITYLGYEFTPGKPNFLANTSIGLELFSYTKTLAVEYEAADGSVTPWLPLINPATNAPDVYRAYLLGSQNFGTNFFTSGPETVDYVLRDPPGGASSATRTVGSVVSDTETWGWNLGVDVTSVDKVDLGANFGVGFGVIVATEVEQNTAVGSSASISGGRSGSLERTIENTSEWSTNSNPDNVGTGSDIYLGHSTNVEFGVSDYLKLVPDSMCAVLGGCELSLGNGFSVAKTSSLSIVPGGYSTGFIYTQDFIENEVIPDLKDLRNVILLDPNGKYVSNLVADAQYFGYNNDDTVFGNLATPDPDRYNYPGDFDGESYTYTPVTEQDTLIDTVRFLNQQIALWERAIWLNEFEKVNIDNPVVLTQLLAEEIEKIDTAYAATNRAYFTLEAAFGTAAIGTAIGTAIATAIAPAPGFAFVQSVGFIATTGTGIAATETIAKRQEYLDKINQINARFADLDGVNRTISGGTSSTFTTSSQRIISEENTFEFGASASLSAEVSANVNGTGVGFESGLTVNFQRNSANSLATDTNNTISYTLADDDNADVFSVDVYKSMNGWGPIFKRRPGGKSGCPFEDEEVTAYYEPGTIIAEATLQRDLPGLTVDQTIITNVPSDEAAVFNFTLSNLTQTGDDQPYTVTSLTEQNPFGAIVRINGSASVTPQVSAGTEINLTLTVNKGPGAQYNYDSLLVIAHSVCQYDFGISPTFKDIADSVWISAHFIPACTDVELLDPDDSWVLNNSFEDTLDLIAGGYNINFFDLNRIRFEYKPSSSPNWIGLESFYKDTVGIPANLLTMPTNLPFTKYEWLTNLIPDGNYDLQISSLCNQATETSPIYSGIMDRINPHPFGTPSPADGILDANEDISIRFNEPIDLGALTLLDFDVRGILNQTPSNRYTSLFFDGIDDYVEMTGGANITNRDFTVEFWARRSGLGKEVVFSQGFSPIENLSIGFNAADQFSFVLGSEEVNSTDPVTDGLWHHYAASYNFDNETMELFVDGSLANAGNINLFGKFVARDELLIGKNASIVGEEFNGNIQDIRVWNNYRTLSDIIPDINIRLSSSELGLLYNWRFDEATDLLTVDHVRRRDGIVNGAEWVVEPNGSAIIFDGTDDYLEISSAGNVAITNEMDLTLEFWFNSTSTNVSTMFANGYGDGLQADSILSWNIEKDAAGLIHVKHNGVDFVATNTDYFDGQWHHFAIVLNRSGNLTSYIDGNIENVLQATNFEQFGGGTMWLGARGYYLGTVINTDQYFDGMMDEFRFWNTARKIEQVTRDKQNRLLGDELGLLAYIPFEDYQELLPGILNLTPSFTDLADTSHLATAFDNAANIGTTPKIKIQRPIQPISITYSVNSDEIIISPIVSPALIENVSFDVTVANVKDLNGNVMQSPKTWIAYIDKNQVIWQDDLLVFEKDFGQTLNFSSAILNNGGEAKVYDITNLPEWLTVSQTTGSIAPNSVQTIDFTIAPGTNIGDYTEDIHLTTDFGFPEKLSIQLKVREEAPDWSVNPIDFPYSMSIIGYLDIEDVISTDIEDVIGVFSNDQQRGSAQVEYVPALDRYLVFLDVYAPTVGGNALTFRIWDASTGNTYVDVIPNLTFNANTIVGEILDPQLFETGNGIVQDIDIYQGYNWISFNLLTPDSANLENLLESYSPFVEDGLYAIGQSEYVLRSINDNWDGPLNVSGVSPENGYRLKSREAGQKKLSHYGSVIDPTSRTITLREGWNWIGFISIRNQPLAQALGNLNPSEGDLIKGKNNFAVYNTALGWIGSLTTLEPGKSYMYDADASLTFTFPFAGAFKSNGAAQVDTDSDLWELSHRNHPGNMTHITSLDLCEIDSEEFIENGDWIIGVFDKNDECRALAELDNTNNKLVSFVTVSGTSKEALEYRLLNKVTGAEFTAINRLDFNTNELRGSLTEPYTISLSDEDCKRLTSEVEFAQLNQDFMVYPTLFEDEVSILFTSESEQSIEVSLYNNMGQRLFYSNYDVLSGKNRVGVSFENIELPIGTYYLEVQSSHESVKHSKLIKY